MVVIFDPDELQDLDEHSLEMKPWRDLWNRLVFKRKRKSDKSCTNCGSRNVREVFTHVTTKNGVIEYSCWRCDDCGCLFQGELSVGKDYEGRKIGGDCV